MSSSDVHEGVRAGAVACGHRRWRPACRSCAIPRRVRRTTRCRSGPESYPSRFDLATNLHPIRLEVNRDAVVYQYRLALCTRLQHPELVRRPGEQFNGRSPRQFVVPTGNQLPSGATTHTSPSVRRLALGVLEGHHRAGGLEVNLCPAVSPPRSWPCRAPRYSILKSYVDPVSSSTDAAPVGPGCRPGTSCRPEPQTKRRHLQAARP